MVDAQGGEVVRKKVVEEEEEEGVADAQRGVVVRRW